MTEDDLPEVAALEAREQPAPWSERVFREELAQSNRVYLVAEGDRIVGFAGLMIVGEEAHVTNLLVASGARRGGIGRWLARSLIDLAIQRGALHMTLEVRLSNEPARRLYSSLGLAPVGIRPRFYGEEDALIMWAHDIGRRDHLETVS